MPRDFPDWGDPTLREPVHELKDLGELAARLGSIDTFDRRGDVFFLDGFEDGINKWEVDFSGTGAAVASSAVRARNGSFSALLTAGSSVDHYADIAHYEPIPSLSSLIGFEASFQVALAESVRLTVQVWDGENQLTFVVLWDNAADELQYEDSSSVLRPFATGVDLQTSATMFHTAKLVIDPATAEYVRFILDSTTYSLAGIAANSGALAASRALLVEVRNTGRSGQNDKVYVDDPIITQNEPAQP